QPALLRSLEPCREEVCIMKRLLLLAAAACALAVPAAASAHPLGNFTSNHFARVEVADGRLYVRYVLDLAEIPTYQARQRGVDAGVYASRIAAGLRVTLDGRPAALRPVAHALAFPAGVGGLRTMRLEVILRGPAVDGRSPLPCSGARRTHSRRATARRSSPRTSWAGAAAFATRPPSG